MASTSSTVSPEYKQCGIVVKNVVRQCIICEVCLSNQQAYDAHVNGRGHKLQVRRQYGITMPNLQGMRYCTLCNYAKLPSNSQVRSHINGKYHQTQLEQIQFSDEEYSTIPLNASFLLKMTGVVDGDDDMKYCILCDVQLPGRSQLEAHTNGKNHQSQIKESGIIIRNGIRYCTLCDAELPGDSQMESHINGKNHQNQIQSTSESYDYSAENEYEKTTYAESYDCSAESEYEETTYAASITSTNSEENDVFIMKTEYGHYCTLCDAKLINDHNYHFHVNGSVHRQNIQDIQKYYED